MAVTGSIIPRDEAVPTGMYFKDKVYSVYGSVTVKTPIPIINEYNKTGFVFAILNIPKTSAKQNEESAINMYPYTAAGLSGYR